MVERTDECLVEKVVAQKVHKKADKMVSMMAVTMVEY